MNLARDLAIIALLAWCFVGCDAPPPGRVAPPPFNANGLFGSMRTAPKTVASQTAKEDDEAWGDAEQEEDDMGGEQPVATQSVLLGGRFISVLPGTDWEVANAGLSTFIVHTPPGGEPDAFVYARAFSPKMAKQPVVQTRAFVQGVDPTHDVHGSFGGIGLALLAQFAGGTGLDMDEVGQCLATLSSPAGSHGLGFRTDAKRSHGVRWLGQSADGLFFRLARLEGRWTSEPIKLDCDKVLKGVASAVASQVQEKVPGELGEDIAAAVDDFANEEPASTGSSASVSAQAVVGTVASADNETAGIHLAVVCVAEPKCVEAEALTRFVEEMHIPTADERAMAGGPDQVNDALDNLAARVGVAFDEKAAGLAAVTKALTKMQQTLEKATGGAAKEGGGDAAPEAAPEGAEASGDAPAEAAEPAEEAKPVEEAAEP